MDVMLVAVVELVKLFPLRSRSETEETDVSYNDGSRLLLLLLSMLLLLLLFPLFDAENGTPLLLVDGDVVVVAAARSSLKRILVLIPSLFWRRLHRAPRPRSCLVHFTTSSSALG